MNVIEQKIESFYKENEKSVDVIIEGSDEYLDLILSITLPLNQLTVKFKDFNEFLYSHTNNCTPDQLKK